MGGGHSYAIEKGGHDMEIQARDQLATMNVERNILDRCTRVATVGEGGSYSTLISCIRMERNAKGSMRR